MITIWLIGMMLLVLPIVLRHLAIQEQVKAIAYHEQKHKEWTQKSHEKFFTPTPVEPAIVATPKKFSPRENEQWWINLWLDSWYRQVGTKYVPAYGDADWVEPQVVVKAEVVQPTIKATVEPLPHKGLTREEILEHSGLSQGFKEYARGYMPETIAALREVVDDDWEEQQFGKKLSKADLIGNSVERDFPDRISATAANRNFEQIMALTDGLSNGYVSVNDYRRAWERTRSRQRDVYASELAYKRQQIDSYQREIEEEAERLRKKVRDYRQYYG